MAGGPSRPEWFVLQGSDSTGRRFCSLAEGPPSARRRSVQTGARESATISGTARAFGCEARFEVDRRVAGQFGEKPLCPKSTGPGQRARIVAVGTLKRTLVLTGGRMNDRAAKRQGPAITR